jgi:hypothetical protein
MRSKRSRKGDRGEKGRRDIWQEQKRIGKSKDYTDFRLPLWFSVFTQRGSGSVLPSFRWYMLSLCSGWKCVKWMRLGVYTYTHAPYILRSWKWRKCILLKRRQYGPYPHWVRIRELNQHQKINLPLRLITQHAMHTYWGNFYNFTNSWRRLQAPSSP